MFGSDILEVVIGIVFVYILVSIICSAVREAIEAKLKTRAAYLERGIRELLHDVDGTGLAARLYNHPLIYSLYADRYTPGSAKKRPPILARGHTLPSYIPSGNFATALLDMAVRGTDTDVVSSDPASPVITLQAVRDGVLNLQNQAVQRVLLTAVDQAQGDIGRAQANLEAWYNGSMDRVSGWYKRATHWVIFWIALVVAAALNVNTVTIADYLYRNDAARAAIVDRAEGATTDTAFLSHSYTQTRALLDSLDLPIGWQNGWGAPRPHGLAGPADSPLWNDVFGPILGLLLTALAATLGAPFWFDVLNKVMVIRSTVKPREKSRDEASEDRQTSPRPAPPAAADDDAAGAPPGGAAQGSAPIPAAAVRAAEPGDVPAPPDAESGVDGCEVEMDSDTPDDELPPAEGGVA